MTPAARVAAAIGILDQSLGGAPTERVLTNWARANRYAGSGDRAAIRDLVYDAIRCRRSFAALGGGETGRGLMIGRARALGEDPDGLFTGTGYAPAPLSPDETAAGRPETALSEGERLDLPDWLLDDLRASLGGDLEQVAQRLRARAPVFLRVNLQKTDRDTAMAALAADGIECAPHHLSPTALEVTQGTRRLRNCAAFTGGLVELQDAASQAVVDWLDPPPGARVLDYCAGGGGKALALAARTGGPVHVHDANPARMADIPARAARAGASLHLLDGADAVAGAGPFDLVLLDVPCSGSGAWRRQPDAKWALTRGGLDALLAVQAGILAEAQALVAPGGRLAYATCSLLEAENAGQIARFTTENPGWRSLGMRVFTPLDGGDGLFVAQLTRDQD